MKTETPSEFLDRLTVVALLGLLFTSKPVHAYVLQIIVVANHMSGKDTHIRGLKILGPTEYVNSLPSWSSHKPDRSRLVRDNVADDDPFPFTSPAFKMYETIR